MYPRAREPASRERSDPALFFSDPRELFSGRPRAAPSYARFAKLAVAGMTALPPLPDIALELVEVLSRAHEGFLHVVRRKLRARYPDGTTSQPFIYDEVDRAWIDAVVIAAYYRTGEGEPCVYLRSALRPPVVFRDPARSPTRSIDPKGSIWELPAGLVESGEQSLEGVRRCAARELEEELGFHSAPDAIVDLGPSSFVAPGFIAERHFFVAVEVSPATRREPSLDGSPLEAFGVVHALPLENAIACCRDGRIVDEKTEIGLRRLKELLA
jgi:ADP-ribose pyrophosphatase